MDIDHEGIYFAILSGEDVGLDDGLPFLTGYEHVTKEEILEILKTHFGVDFGYDVEQWEEYIKDNGGFLPNYTYKGLAETERMILKKYRNK